MSKYAVRISNKDCTELMSHFKFSAGVLLADNTLPAKAVVTFYKTANIGDVSALLALYGTSIDEVWVTHHRLWQVLQYGKVTMAANNYNDSYPFTVVCESEQSMILLKCMLEYTVDV